MEKAVHAHTTSNKLFTLRVDMGVGLGEDQDETSLGPYMSFLSKVLSVLSFQGCSGSSRYFWVCFKACGTLFKGINLNSG